MALRGVTGVAITTSASSGSITYSGANSIQVGDLLIAHVYQSVGGAATYTDPSGWTPGSSIGLPDVLVGSDRHIAVKIATSADTTNPAYTWSTPYSGVWIIQLRAYSGRINSSVGAAFPNNAATANGTTGNAPYTYSVTGLTPSAGDDVVCFIISDVTGGDVAGYLASISGFANELSTVGTTGITGPATASLDSLNVAGTAIGPLSSSLTFTNAATLTPNAVVLSLPAASASPTPHLIDSGGHLIDSGGKLLTGAMLPLALPLGALRWVVNRRNLLMPRRKP